MSTTTTANVDETDSKNFAALDPFYSPENQAYVLKSVRELREGKGTIHKLIENCDD